ncbi:CoA transferase [Amycolatopsis acidiphila]|uniref:CoA transferase n=1 Tax=Amycolatopsis acidiphila TaxID=715473 RepID=A0A557ZXW7_9PSEU|nr:CoA transferase [Amycolatopsis acidiphila]TVT16847.1 CoA transferase [Amycolatopsis acidiphila]UIJ63051.1 CoA transferase [Amycolatopsis acidiphila]GHG65857.1 CoA transferase [Amycolatopsis acidiphila]
MKPLEDVRVVALEQYGAGPFGSLHLAHLGADVIKIEDPVAGGDIGRYVPPFAEGEDSLFFESFNRNKRSVSLDVGNPEGRAVLEDLVRNADAVYSNLRGDVPAKLGIRYEDLKDVNPRIVCCSLSGFGMTGPRAAEPGYDYVLQGLAGWMTLTGDPDGPPEKTGLSLVDYSGGFVAAISLLAGVHAARRDGVGMDCDVSLYDTAISLLTYPAAWHLTAGYEPRRSKRSAHPSLVPFQAFAAKDGWLVLGCAKEKFWQRLTVVLGRPELAEDPRFATFADRHRNRDQVQDILDEILSRRTVEEWLGELRSASVPCAPVNEVGEALRDEHTLARNLIVETEHPRFGKVRQVASPVRAGDEAPHSRRAPQRGEHTLPVLRGLLGYDDERMRRLAEAGAFGMDSEAVTRS